MNKKLTDKERKKVWNSYSDDLRKNIKRINEWLTPGQNFTVERW